MRLAEAAISTVAPRNTGSTTSAVAVQTIVVPLALGTPMNDPLGLARSLVGQVADGLDPGGGPVKDAIENAIEVAKAWRELFPFGAAPPEHFAIVSNAAFSTTLLTDGLGVANGFMSGDRFKLEVAGIDFGADIMFEVTSKFIAQLPHAQLIDTAARLVVSFGKFVTPVAVAAFESARAQAKAPVPTLAMQLLRFYAQETGVDDSAHEVSYRPLSSLSPTSESDVVVQPWRNFKSALFTELPLTKSAPQEYAP
jgi:hypothetical protein